MDMIKQIFMNIDTNKSGFIEWDELKNFMCMFAQMMNMEEPSDKQLKMTYKLLDKNQDGKLSLSEMSGVIEQLVMVVSGEFDQQYNQMQY